MISSRFALAVVFILAVALVPTAIHNYFGLVVDDGKAVKTLHPILDTFTSTPTNRKAQWVEEMFDSNDWSERLYTDSHGSKVRLFMARSYNHKRLYHHPELALSYGSDMRAEGIVLLPGQPEIPVHLLRSKAGLAAYVLLYDDEFVSNPILHQILDSLSLLFRGRKPLTLLYVSVPNTSNDSDFTKSAAASILIAAIRSFRS